MSINELFATVSGTTTNSGNSQLAGTATLTSLATGLAEGIITAMAADTEKYSSKLIESQSDMTVLDELITTLGELESADINFLRELDKSVLESMLKSQQSKRSRCKSKDMTQDNYKSMMTAAIAESLIRDVLGKAKGTTGARGNGAVSYSEERLAELAEDQEALRKEIRNVQSKKSIMKSKAGFSEDDEKWQMLLTAEEQLKAIRSDAPRVTKVVTVDETRDFIRELLAEVDIDKATAKDIKALMHTIHDNVFADDTEEEQKAETPADNETTDEVQ